MRSGAAVAGSPFTTSAGAGAPALVVRRRSATWVIPAGEPAVAAAAFGIHRPTSWRDTLIWHGFRGAARAGLLARRSTGGIGLRDDLAAPLAGRLGRSDLRFALSLPPGGDRATVAAVTPDGAVVAFGKLAIGAATERVERERAALERVGPLLPACVAAPAVRFSGRVAEAEVLLMTPVTGGRVPARIGRVRAEALAALVRPAERPPLKELVPAAAPLDGEWDELLPAASERLAGWWAEPVPSAVVHGDFTPWNVAARPGGFGACDWEDVMVSGAPFWDLWHFAVMSGSLLRRWTPGQLAAAALRRTGPLGPAVRAYTAAAGLRPELATAVLVAYLAASGTVLGAHGGLDRPDRVAGLRYRAVLLRELLGGWR